MSTMLFALQVPAMTEVAIARTAALEAELSQVEQADLTMHHSFHAGMYARTVDVPAGCTITGALIKIPTLLIISGDVQMFTGDGVVRLSGYNVMQAAAHRKQAFLALADTAITMLFATNAATVDEAEREFTDEYEKLTTRKDQP